MARTPVTKVQLDAYRFGQRRLESALACGDPLLLHERVRGQQREVAIGLALSVLVLAGFVGYAHVTGKVDWRGQ